MPLHRVAGARCIFALLALAAIALASTGCGPRSRDLQPGSYRAVLELPGGELPFGLDVAREESGLVLYLVNGTERVRVHEVTVEPGRLTAKMPGFENTLEARVSGDELEGELTLLRRGGETQVLPFKAKLGATWRFFEEPLTDNADVAGRWSVTFTDGEGKKTPAVAELAQSFGTVTGTILTPTGDHRFLAGEVRGDDLRLSCFDGAHAYLYHAKVGEQGNLVGEFWSGKAGHERFVARRDPDAVLDTSAVDTGIKDRGVRLEFAFPDLNGQTVSLADARFQGRPVIVVLAGSWCPNCHDEAAFLAPLYAKYRDQGLEVVSLMFEHFGDFERAAAATRRFRTEFGIEYVTLIAGISDKTEAAKVLPQLTGVFAFPTTIFLDRTGRVRKIHAGFSGPATGSHYEQLTHEFTSLVETLLAEPAGAPAGDAGRMTPAAGATTEDATTVAPAEAALPVAP
jgi:thiol-disulfide isomerase/thioredoxin